MPERKPALTGLATYIADDASEAVIAVETGGHLMSFSVQLDQIPFLQDKLRVLEEAWEARQKAMDPTSGGPGHFAPMTAIVPDEAEVAMSEDGRQMILCFKTKARRQNFSLPTPAMQEIARRVLRLADRPPPRLPRH